MFKINYLWFHSARMDPVDLNKYLLTRSYLIGNSFTYADLTLFNLIHEKRSQYTKFTHVVRWLNHIKAIRNCTNDSLSSGKHTMALAYLKCRKLFSSLDFMMNEYVL